MTVKAKIKMADDHTMIVPIVVPDLDEVRPFANDLHRKGVFWSGDAFGWSAEYNPGSDEPPLESNMAFTPADFVIGDSEVWFFSLMWENGPDADPVEFLDNGNLI